MTQNAANYVKKVLEDVVMSVLKQLLNYLKNENKIILKLTVSNFQLLLELIIIAFIAVSDKCNQWHQLL